MSACFLQDKIVNNYYYLYHKLEKTAACGSFFYVLCNLLFQKSLYDEE